MTFSEDAMSEPSRAMPAVGELASISIDCPDPSVLADFYSALLGMGRVYESPDGGVISLSAGGVCVTLMRVADYQPPTWPEPGHAQQMHLDLAVTDLDAAQARAEHIGARAANHQAGPELWRVMLDPVGHPFCLSAARPD